MKSCVSRQDAPGLSRTQRVLSALTEICEHLDLANPIWLQSNIREFKRKSRTSFRKDSFIEYIPFDSLTIEVIEEQ